MNDVDLKEALKEAIKEWMDDRMLQFGRWSFGAFASAAFFAIVYFVLTMQGWHK